VTLVMALVFTSGWVRSQSVEDEFALNLGGALNDFDSGLGKIHLSSWDDPNSIGCLDWTCARLEGRQHTPTGSFPVLIRLKIRRIKTNMNWKPQVPRSYRINQLVIPYWSIVIPLTVTSAFLLFSRPRSSIQTKITEPTAAEGMTS